MEEYGIGTIAGIAAIVLFVLVKSVFWYAIPPIVKQDNEKKPYIPRQHSTAHRVINRIALFLTFAGLGVAAYFNGFEDAILFGAVLMLLMVVIYRQETTRLIASLKDYNLSIEDVLESENSKL